MGLLNERTCGHCQHLFDAVTCGVCEMTAHKVIHTEDEDFAKQCPLYENKYGYEEHKEPDGNASGERREDMYDYEIKGYRVIWKTGEKIHTKTGFITEESAVDFAKKKLKTADFVNLIQERHAIGWWK